MQEEMKEVGDSVHTGEKNLMPSMLKRRVGKNTVASDVDGECSRTETSRRSSATRNKLGKERDSAARKENSGKKKIRNKKRSERSDKRIKSNKSIKDHERCSRRVIERKQACRRAGSVAISVALPPLPSLVPSARTHVQAARSRPVYVDHAHMQERRSTGKETPRLTLTASCLSVETTRLCTVYTRSYAKDV